MYWFFFVEIYLVQTNAMLKLSTEIRDEEPGITKFVKQFNLLFTKFSIS